MFGMITGKLWQITTIALLVVCAVSGIYIFFMKGQIADLKTELKASQIEVASLTSAIEVQNAAVKRLEEQKIEAEKRLALALEVSKEKGKRADAALNKAKGAKAKTCQEAMPVVREVLKELNK